METNPPRSSDEVDDVVSRPTVVSREVDDDELSAILDDVLREEELLDDVLDDVAAPVKRIPEDVERKVHEMLPASDRLSWARTSQRFRAVPASDQAAARADTERIYKILVRLGKESQGAKGGVLRRYRQQRRQYMKDLETAIERNLRHYDSMNEMEQRTLFYVADDLMLRGNAEGALRLLNSKGVTLDRFASYSADRRETLFRAYLRAGRNFDLREFVLRAGTARNEGSVPRILSVLGDLEEGAIGVAHHQMNIRKQKLIHLEITGGVVPDVYAERWLETLALGRELLFEKYPTPALGEQLDFFARNGFLEKFIASKRVPAKSKAMLGVLIQSLAVGDPHIRRQALGYISQLEKGSLEFLKVLAVLIRTPGVEEVAMLELIYDALYGVPSSLARKNKMFYPRSGASEAEDPGRRALQRLLSLDIEGGGAPGAGGGMELSPKLEALRNLELANHALERGHHDDVLRYAQRVLTTSDRRVLLPGAVHRAHELKILVSSQKLKRALEEGTGVVPAREFAEASEAFTAAKAAKVKLPYKTEIDWLSRRAEWEVAQGQGNAAVMTLWEVAQLKFLDQVTNKSSTASVSFGNTHPLIEDILDRFEELGVDAKHQDHLVELTRFWEPDGVPVLESVPRKYRGDAVYRMAELQDSSSGGKQKFIEEAEQALLLNPHPVLRDHIHLILGEQLTDMAQKPEQALFHFDVASRSQNLSKVRRAQADLGTTMVRLEQHALPPRELKRLRHRLLRLASKTKRKSAYFVYVRSMRRVLRGSMPIEENELQSLLGALNHAIALVEATPSLSHLRSRLRRDRAFVIDDILSKAGTSGAVRIRHITEHPGLDGNTGLRQLAAADRFVFEMQEAAAAR